MTSPQRRLTAATVVVLLLSTFLVGLLATPASAAPAVPGGLPAGIEAMQPYVGQSTCDPVAKPGVRAFMNMVLDTYRDTSSLGITRDCGIGGQSEHKEGRAWDWGVSVTNPTQVAHVNDLLHWLMATDSHGNTYAMIRRLGIMYIIWNQHMWRAYAPEKGWQPYTGDDPHTGHVHFSFGWAGAKQLTSFWTKKVAPIDYGPNHAPVWEPPVVTPTAVPANLPVLASYGGLTLSYGATGPAVSALQSGLGLPAEGTFGSHTQTAVRAFQSQQHLSVTGSFGPSDWPVLFPKPTTPFGALETVDPGLGRTLVTGWGIDADQDLPLTVRLYVDGVALPEPSPAWTTDQDRPDITSTYTDYPATHGFRIAIDLADGLHQVCARLVNLPGTRGVDTVLPCHPVLVQHSAIGQLESFTQGPAGIVASGWALDPDTASPVDVQLELDGGEPVDVLADVRRDSLAARFPDYGPSHAFSTVLTATEGLHRLCGFAVNATDTPGGDPTSLGCRTLVVRHDAAGTLAPVTTAPGTVLVTGTALDPDTSGASTAVVTVDGSARPALTADRVGSVLPGYPAYGASHAFATSLVLPSGQHTICVAALNVSGTPGHDRPLGCGTVTVLHSPLGALQQLRQEPAGLVLRGWALDPDSAASSGVRLTVDGVRGDDVVASIARTDLPATIPGVGTAHGFATPLDLPAGAHTVCVTALNVAGTPGSDRPIGCLTATVRHAPVGGLSPVYRVPGGLRVRGWAIDPDSAGAVATSVLLDGKQVATPNAGITRTDIGTAYPGYGSAHAFDVTLPVSAGVHQVCVTALNAASTPGADSALGCSTLTVTNTPTTVLTGLVLTSSGLLASGWAIDPDTTASLTEKISVDGRLLTLVSASYASSSLAAAHPGYGPHHVFRSVLHLSRGWHTVCVAVDNAKGTPGGPSAASCHATRLP